MNTHFVEDGDGNPDVLRFPRLENSDHAAMIEVWNDEIWGDMPTRRQVRIAMGKRLFLIKSLLGHVLGHGKFRRWYDEQGYEFGFRSAEKYMSEALEHYRKPNTNNYSLSPVTDGVHAKTADKKAEFNGSTYSFILNNLSPNQIERLRSLRKSDERIKAESAVIKSLQPWLRGDRVANRPA